MRLLVPLLLLTASHTQAAPAFPGADGYGRDAAGGRGGRVIAVTTLADAGPGSLRACIDAKGPRVCVFRVGGVIRFVTRRPVIRNPYITIAGETAPGGGILLTHNGGDQAFTPLVVKDTHNVVIRHIRVRPDRLGTDRGANGAVTVESSRDVIIDHVSGSWALDQNLTFYGFNDRVTVSWSIFSEGIPRHDKCALLASHPKRAQRISFIRNICAHNGDRNPDVNFFPGSCVEVVNNLFYNAQSQFAEVWESWGGTPVSIVGNHFRKGPNTSSNAAGIDRPLIGSTGPARIFARDNVFDGVPDYTMAARLNLVGKPSCRLTVKAAPGRTVMPALLARAGALPRDAFDQRIVREVATRTGRIVASPGTLPVIASGVTYPDADADGMDDRWEARNGAQPGRFDAWENPDAQGFLNLDRFLDWRHRQLVAGVKAR